VNMLALRALKGVEVESNSCGHDTKEHHASMAPWAGMALDLNTDIVWQKIRFLHMLPLEQAGAQHSLSPISALVSSVIGAVLGFRFPSRCSILIRVSLNERICSTSSWRGHLDFRHLLTARALGRPTGLRRTDRENVS
jgi:hypothetical protein